MPTIGTNLGFSPQQSNPTYTTVKQWGSNFYVQQYHQSPGKNYQHSLTKTEYWGGTPGSRTVAADHTKLTPAATKYRPLEALPGGSAHYNNFQTAPVETHFGNSDYYRAESFNRYNEFFKRYYDWYYRNAFRDGSTVNGSPKGPYPQGPYPGPLQGPVSPSAGQTPQSPTGAPWWLNGGFAGSPPGPSLPSASSGGPVGPFVAPAIPPQGSLPKKAPLAGKGKNLEIN